MNQPAGNGSGGRRAIEDRVAARRRSTLVANLRRLAAGAPGAAEAGAGTLEEACDLCGVGIQEKHNHLLQLTDRRILCVCTSCWAQRSADPEYRPTGSRVLWLEDFRLPEDLWGRLQIPIGLAFFIFSSATDSMIALYPSPAGATESELELGAWEDLVRENPALESLEPDAEALVVNRITEPAQFAIVPIDECYGLVGAVKASWEGISGGAAIEREVPQFFEGIRRRAVVSSR
jgi:hypothetical protein